MGSVISCIICFPCIFLTCVWDIVIECVISVIHLISCRHKLLVFRTISLAFGCVFLAIIAAAGVSTVLIALAAGLLSKAGHGVASIIQRMQSGPPVEEEVPLLEKPRRYSNSRD
ncbi:hypothetical protein C8Q74DRAFT_576701 [Fomes fomentarius]|nr:hypothetical protein C8Q74DRAFT_576701 [Fomes fomentarius]